MGYWDWVTQHFHKIFNYAKTTGRIFTKFFVKHLHIYGLMCAKFQVNRTMGRARNRGPQGAATWNFTKSHHFGITLALCASEISRVFSPIYTRGQGKSGEVTQCMGQLNGVGARGEDITPTRTCCWCQSLPHLKNGYLSLMWIWYLFVSQNMPCIWISHLYVFLGSG